MSARTGKNTTTKPAAGAAFLRFCFFLACITAAFPAFSSSLHGREVRLGVLAKQGSEQCLKKWSPTAAYLTARIPGRTFVIVPLSFQKMLPAVADRAIDFVLANPAIYVELESRYGVNRITTLVNSGHQGGLTRFGGVIFCRADRLDLNSLEDLRGKSFAAVGKNSLGGWIAAWRELKRAGLDPYRIFSRLTFAGTNDAVVFAVLHGKTDAGTVRTDTLEQMATEGKIDRQAFRVIQAPLSPWQSFPFALSTRLYPEWPLAKVKHTPDDLSKRVAMALLDMPPDSPAAQAAKIQGWTTPLQYRPVHDSLKELWTGPYQKIGKVSLTDILRQYWRWLIAFAIILLILIFTVVHGRRLNHSLEQAKRKLELARHNLEDQVRERTTDLTRSYKQLRREAEERHRSEKFIKEVLENIGEGLIVIDDQYRIVLANKAYCEQVKIPAGDVQGDYCYAVSHRISRPCFEAGEECPARFSFETGEPCSLQHIHHDDSNLPVYVEVKSYPIKNKAGEVKSVIEIVNDVTEKKKLEDQLRHAQKMEVVGRLAGGVAHDFNNILTVIAGYIELMRAEIGKNSPMKDSLDNISTAASRAARLTASLLAFSRKQVIHPVVVNLDRIILDAEKLLSRLVGEDIELEILPAGNNPKVMADSSQIEQALMNLAANARDAMPEGGRLTIETHVEELDNEYVKMHGHGKAGEFALLSVTDTGSGMDETTKEKIFEPFFTTKEVGKGTGLGLAMVYGTVKQHNGYVNVYSEQGGGTTFKIYLPLSKEGNENIPVQEKEDSAAAGGSETVLLAEDDEAVRQFVHQVLERAGYKVITAGDGDEALNRFRQHAEEIDILFLDTIMPGKNGKEVYETIRQKHPDIKAVFTSGYSENIIHSRGILQGGLNFISKPASPREILKKLREVLDS